MNTLEYNKMELALARLKRDYSKIGVSYAHHIKTLEQHDAQLKLIQTNIEKRTAMKDITSKTMTQIKEKIDSLEKTKDNIPVPPTQKDIADKFMEIHTRWRPEAEEITFTKIYKLYCLVLKNIVTDPTCKMKEADFRTYLADYIGVDTITRCVKGIYLFHSKQEAEDWDKEQTY